MGTKWYIQIDEQQTGTAMDEDLSFGTWLRQRRRALGLTQAELGQRIGYARETVRKVEAGARSPSRQMAEQLAEHLEIPATERAAFLALARPDARLADLPVPPPTGAVGPRASLGSPWAALPTPPTELIGRERELADLQDLLRVGNVRLLTLTGPPGVGKTRLAIAVAALLGDRFTHGVTFVSLAPIANARLVFPTVARALGVPETVGGSVREALQTYLRSRQLLLLLDNFESVLEAASELAELLAAAPGLVALVTSRERLRLRGERIVVVPPLSLPADAPAVASGDLLASPGESAAVRLFVARARDVQPAFALTPTNAAAIGAICRRLDGLPLAIELAAAHSRALPPPMLLARLVQGLEVLDRGARDLPARQQSLRATIAWSYDRLSSDEQRVLRRLAVFAGGCTAEAAEFVGAPARGPGTASDGGAEVVDLLETLVDRSLIVQEENPASGGGPEPRFGMLETIRAFAREQLARAGEEAVARERHRAWCVALAERAEAEIQGAEQVTWMDRLDREQSNLRAALAWSLEHDRAAALRLGRGLWRFWRQRGYLDEGRRWLEAILARSGDARGEDRVSRGWALVGAGIIATMQGDLGPARSLLTESVATFREVGDPVGLAQALRDLGYLLLISGDDPAEARTRFEEALSVARAREDARATGAALYLLGLLAEHERDFTRARVVTDEGLALFRRLGDLWSIATCLHQLGRVALAEGDLDQAEARLRELQRLARQRHDRQNHGLATLGLAVVALRQGDLPQTQQFLKECVPHFHAVHDPAVYSALGLLGEVAIQTGELTRGVHLLAAGAVDAQWRNRTRTGIDPLTFPRAEDAEALARARDALGDQEFDRAWAEGQTMTRDQAVSLALTLDEAGRLTT